MAVRVFGCHRSNEWPRERRRCVRAFDSAELNVTCALLRALGV